MIDPEALLIHARGLAGQGRGRPPTISLRRGVSAAYYAVFHFLTLLATDHVLAAADDAVKASVRRTWTHGELKSTARMIVDRAKVLGANPHADATPETRKWGRLVDLAAGDGDIVESCRRFDELQDHRHAADYDHQAVFDKARLLSCCQDAEDAMRALLRAHPVARQAFLTMLVVRRKDLEERR